MSFINNLLESASIRVSIDAATGRLTPSGVMHTAISLEVQALTSTVSYPTPNRATILNLSDFADLASDELTGGYDVVKGERIKIQGFLEDFALSKTEADDLIMSARNIIYKD